jgi:ribosomal protein S18 acetylase RimI-like enzyme
MSTITDLPLRRASEDDLPELVTTLSLAFWDDPVFSWAIPDGDDRRAVLPGVFTLFARAHLPLGATFVAPGGAALWAPAGVDPIPADRVEAFVAEMANVVGTDAPRMFAISELLDEHHPTEPCAHLQFIGVDPDLQGRGLGSALMAPMLEACDRDGVPAHLDSTSPQSRALYERLGFVVLEELRVADSPPLWSMWREPATSV